MKIVYFFVVFLATTIGSLAGIGGGVIIKPLYDLIGYHDVNSIGFYSAISVFTMCVVSLIKLIRQGRKLNLKLITMISLGAIIGGYLGEFILGNLTNVNIKGIQALILMLIFVIILISSKYHSSTKTITSSLVFVVVGLMMGTISVSLGIGGGPLNMAVLTIFLGFKFKEAVGYSLAIIFFSQLTKLLNITLSNQLINYDLSFIPYLCIAAAIGGTVGTAFNQRLKSERIIVIYRSTLVVLIVVSLINVYMAFS